MNIEKKQLKSIPLVYYAAGPANAPLLVCLHAAFLNHDMFKQQVQYFKGNYRLLMPDLLGHGESQNIKTKQSIADSAAHINEMMEQEGGCLAHFLGVSIGGLLAQDFANRYPDRVLSLCAVGAYDINNYNAVLQRQQSKQQLGFMAKALVSIPWFSKSNAAISAITPAAQQHFFEMNRVYKRSSLRYMATLGTIMNRPNPPKYTYPLLILCGQHDNELALTLATSWHQSTPQSQHKIIADAGHCVNMDNPVVFNKTVEEFLKSTAPKQV